MLLLPPLGWYEPLRFTFWNHDVYQHPMMSLPRSQLRLFRTERLLWRCLEGFGQPLPGRALIICLRNTRPQGDVNHDDQIDPKWWHRMVALKLKGTKPWKKQSLPLKTFQAPLSSVAKAAAKDSAMQVMDTLWWTNIAIENCHRNSGFSH